MGTLFLLSSITELQIPTAVLDSLLEHDRDTNIIQPTLRHLRMQPTMGTIFMGMHALRHIYSLHLQGFGDALQTLWLGGRIVPALRFLTLQFVPPPQAEPPDFALLTVAMIAECTHALERLKIADLSGILPLGTLVFRCLHRFAHLRVFAITVKSMEYSNVKDLVAALPDTVDRKSVV